jgi:hypothetical protein
LARELSISWNEKQLSGFWLKHDDVIWFIRNLRVSANSSTFFDANPSQIAATKAMIFRTHQKWTLTTPEQ